MGDRNFSSLGDTIKKYEIDPMEKEILAMIDEMTIHKGYGAWRMADLLNKEGRRTRSGEKFTGLKISRILKDPYYCGRFEDGSTSDALQALRLRSDETYSQIMYIMEQRSRKNEEKRGKTPHRHAHSGAGIAFGQYILRPLRRSAGSHPLHGQLRKG